MDVQRSYGDVKWLKYCREFWGGPNTKVVQYIDAINGIGKEREHSVDRLQLTASLLFGCDQVAQIDWLATNTSLTTYFIVDQWSEEKELKSYFLNCIARYVRLFDFLFLWHESKTCITKSKLSKCPW